MKWGETAVPFSQSEVLHSSSLQSFLRLKTDISRRCNYIYFLCKIDFKEGFVPRKHNFKFQELLPLCVIAHIWILFVGSGETTVLPTTWRHRYKFQSRAENIKEHKTPGGRNRSDHICHSAKKRIDTGRTLWGDPWMSGLLLGERLCSLLGSQCLFCLLPSTQAYFQTSVAIFLAYVCLFRE